MIIKTGGVTLTLGIAYLTVLAHERNRTAQAQQLRSQSRLLQSVLEPPNLPPPQTRAELAREERSTLLETAKDRWNQEVEGAVRWVQRTDWDEVREGLEGSISRLLGTGLQKSREGIVEAEKQAGPKVQETVDKSRAAAQKGANQAAIGINKAAASAIAGAEKVGTEAQRLANKAGDAVKVNSDGAVASTKTGLSRAGEKIAEENSAAKAKADRAAADVRSNSHDAADAIRSSGGTVDAARGAVRDVISRGIEKGKEAIGKAQSAVGMATEKVESNVPASSFSTSSLVEKALHQRYEKPDGLNKSVEEVLAERYQPIDSRDNTVLRGV